MGAPKQKWTPEEEAALRAGVEKYGAGKWRAIQKDEELGLRLISRSNVDLKDKWRNMSVSANGLGSREKTAKAMSLKMGSSTTKQVEGALQLPPLLESEWKGSSSHSVPGTRKEKRSLGPRYDNLIVEAILGLKDLNGSSKNEIASFVEDHHPVPSNFRRLLTPKLKSLLLQGKLIKIRQNYILSDTMEFTPEEKSSKVRSWRQDSEVKRPDLDAKWQEDEGKRAPRLHKDTPKKFRSDAGSSKLKTDTDVSRFKAMTAAEAARIAAQAVAEAEAAAAAAEEAARAAEIAEAEWEAAEAAAEAAAALASRTTRKSVRTIPAANEGVAVSG